jgi:hypothetical protein
MIPFSFALLVYHWWVEMHGSGQEGHSLDCDEMLSVDGRPEVGVVPPVLEVTEVDCVLSAMGLGIDSPCPAESFPSLLGPTPRILIEELADELEIVTRLGHSVSFAWLFYH